MVSGLATQPTCFSAVRPSRLQPEMTKSLRTDDVSSFRAEGRNELAGPASPIYGHSRLLRDNACPNGHAAGFRPEGTA
jgi:hypothetical protein